MSRAIHSILFLTCLSSVAATNCYTDLKFTVFASKQNTPWVAKGSVDYNVSAGSNTVYDGSSNNAKANPKNQFILDVGVDQCSYNCPNGPFVKVTASATKIPTNGLPGYDYYAGVGYYKYHTNAIDWDKARKICNDEGAHLAVINSEEEAHIFGNYVQNVKVRGTAVSNLAFIGFHDRFVPREYLTIFDQPLNETGFYRWFSAGEPNNAGGIEFCGSVHTNGGLNDVSCTINLAFICEQELC